MWACICSMHVGACQEWPLKCILFAAVKIVFFVFLFSFFLFSLFFFLFLFVWEEEERERLVCAYVR